FSWYARQLTTKKPDERLVSTTEVVLGKEAVERAIDIWRRRIPRQTIIRGPDPNFKPTPEPEPKFVCKPFVAYQKFDPVVPYEPTMEELAEMEHVRKQSEACGTPSEQTARCYLFDRIDTSPSARATLEKQAREDPKAAFHLELLKKKKAAADETKDSEPLSKSEEEERASDEISVKVDDQKELVRQMYAAGSDEDNDKVFQIESGPLNVPASRRCREPISTRCPTGILIDIYFCVQR
ncbi:unnamed protein product, partial [Fusarium langsethiae]